MKIMTGSLIVIDGVDSSGKQTQVEQLCQKLEAEGRKVKRISFPNYDSSSSALVKMYLNGELGTDAEVLDPYAISTFYAADRYISYVTDWKKDLEEGTQECLWYQEQELEVIGNIYDNPELLEIQN